MYTYIYIYIYINTCISLSLSLLAGEPTVRVAIVGSRGTKRPLPGGPGRAPHWRVRPPQDSWSGSCA